MFNITQVDHDHRAFDDLCAGVGDFDPLPSIPGRLTPQALSPTGVAGTHEGDALAPSAADGIDAQILSGLVSL